MRRPLGLDGWGSPDHIVVPFAPEAPASGIEWKGPLQRVWYRRSLPAARPGLRTVLHFGAVDRCAEVWLGGAHVASHDGGYTGFAVDITEHLAEGADVVVRADDDPADLEAPRGKQDWRNEPHEIWYPRTTGIGARCGLSMSRTSMSPSSTGPATRGHRRSYCGHGCLLLAPGPAFRCNCGVGNVCWWTTPSASTV
jgi:hypothetical protein